MRLFYYHSKHGNFGDDLNGWLWERLAPGRWDDRSDTLFSGIGTIIGNPQPPASRTVVFSSGFGYSKIPADWGSDRWKVAAVRGPLTAKVLGLPADAAVADGALLLSTLQELKPIPEPKRGNVIFIPHHTALDFAGWEEACDLSGVDMVDPRGDSHQVIGRIREAKLVIADSMHAAIIADTLRVPWIPVASSNQISTFKWLDWSMSLQVPYEPQRLPIPSARGAFDSWAQKVSRSVNYLEPPTPEFATAHQNKALSFTDDATARKLAWRKRYLHKMPARAMKHSIFTKYSSASDARRVNKTAEALSKHAARKGYLSDESVLKARVDELLSRFNNVINGAFK
ncbi:polysaccharide pyruvyl transferase family protein [Sphingomonas sp. 22R3R2A-7]|uniref:polysaccharide pyruvyl transferase family protein n=1 Tax=Sphingomonas sp. 22R3R2A-7 TaxID=3050230 RepID=UPI002FE0298C